RRKLTARTCPRRRAARTAWAVASRAARSTAVRAVLVAAALCLVPGARAADWSPAKGPLMTRWARDVHPDRTHPEYPRPQLVRSAWHNLNGLWQYAEAKADEKPPVGKELADKILVPFPIESALSGAMKPIRRLWY